MLISNFQRFSVRDGPGIRTTVFTKGCSLRCQWCHNPETLLPKPQVRYFKNMCIHCGRCAQECSRFLEAGGIRLNAPACKECGRCIQACPSGGLALFGTEMLSEDVIAEAIKDRVFFQNSGGGVTISGGEPLLQPDLPDVLQGVQREGIHTAVDTALHVPWSSVERVLPVTSLFLVDIKAMSSQRHKELTQFGNERIIENFEKLLKTDKEIWVRVPFVPEANADEMPLIAEYLKDVAAKRVSVEVIPFHNYASGKYRSLGMPYLCEDFATPDAETYEQCVRLFDGLQMVTYDK